MPLNRANQYCRKKFSHYTISKVVGEGRYGMCFLAYAADNVPVIIKRFKPTLFKKARRNNSNEAILLSQLEHDAIPQLVDVINEKNFYAFVLEQKPGKTIETMIFKDKYSFNNQEIYTIGIQLIDIIKYLHQKGIVHRDIRIPNVILYNNIVYLVDFGLARWVDGQRYIFESDFSYLGDFLLYLLYSRCSTEQKFKNKPWYEELPLSPEQKYFLKRLLNLEEPYITIEEVAIDFDLAFRE